MQFFHHNQAQTPTKWIAVAGSVKRTVEPPLVMLGELT
jgi:hypothetical protein